MNEQIRSAVLDSSALIAYLRGELGASLVESYLKNPVINCFVHSGNIIEVLYDFLKSSGRSSAELALEALLNDNLFIREDLDVAFCWRAASFKEQIRRIAFADCLCLSLADRIGAEVLTADRHELTRVAEQGIVPITFIR
ncbi:MAG: PIN domain-containing protein [Fimbriimonadia bacterium]|nr:PIN domain-containing protein [Fimbriimonadia bacterium]